MAFLRDQDGTIARLTPLRSCIAVTRTGAWRDRASDTSCGETPEAPGNGPEGVTRIDVEFRSSIRDFQIGASGRRMI